MYPRHIRSRIEEALADTPAVLINGPRQSGKSTLAKQFCHSGRQYYTLDDEAVRNAALADPAGFVRSLPEYSVLDEIQRAPQLFLSLKKRIDDNRVPGQLLLTGSANIMVLPQLSDSLAGRIETVPLLPLAETEILQREVNFIDYLWRETFPTPCQTDVLDTVIDRITCGGFPEAISRSQPRRVRAWQQQYLTTMIQRDIKTLSDIDYLEDMPDLLTILANRSAQLLNVSEISKMFSIPRQTTDRYINILRHIFLVEELKPWFSNRNKRLVKTPKVHLLDTGIACRAIDVTAEGLADNRELLGHLLESFIFCELKKQASWSNHDVNFFHYRDRDQYEVDFILESNNKFAAIEVKATATVKKADFNAIERFYRLVNKQFKLGVILYDGDHVLPFGDKLWAVPISCLWS